MKIPHVLTFLQKSTKFIINIMSLQSFSLYLTNTFYIKERHLLIWILTLIKDGVLKHC